MASPAESVSTPAESAANASVPEIDAEQQPQTGNGAVLRRTTRNGTTNTYAESSDTVESDELARASPKRVKASGKKPLAPKKSKPSANSRRQRPKSTKPKVAARSKAAPAPDHESQQLDHNGNQEAALKISAPDPMDKANGNNTTKKDPVRMSGTADILALDESQSMHEVKVVEEHSRRIETTAIAEQVDVSFPANGPISPEEGGDEVEDEINLLSKESPSLEDASTAEDAAIVEDTPTVEDGYFTAPEEVMNENTDSTNSKMQRGPQEELGSTDKSSLDAGSENLQESQKKPGSRSTTKRKRPTKLPENPDNDDFTPTAKKNCAKKTPAKPRIRYTKRWDPKLVISDSKSILIKTNLTPILQSDAAWDLLTPTQQRELIALLPSAPTQEDRDMETAMLASVLADGSKPLPNIPRARLRKSSAFKADVRTFQEDLKEGKLDPVWIEPASRAHERRRNGDFDDWKVQQREFEWAIFQQDDAGE